MYYKNQFELTKVLLQTNIPILDKWDKAVLIQLSSHFKKDKQGMFTAFPSYVVMSKCSGIGKTTVRKSILKLEELQIISSKVRFNNSKVYTWLGFNEVERDFNANPKIKRTQQEWATQRKKLAKIAELQNEIKTLAIDMFNED